MSSPRHLQPSKPADTDASFRQQSAQAAGRKALGLREGDSSSSTSPTKERTGRHRSPSEPLAAESSVTAPARTTEGGSTTRIPLRRSSLGRLPAPPSAADDSPSRLYHPEARSIGYPHPLYLRVPVKDSPERSPRHEVSGSSSSQSSTKAAGAAAPEEENPFLREVLAARTTATAAVPPAEPPARTPSPSPDPSSPSDSAANEAGTDGAAASAPHPPDSRQGSDKGSNGSASQGSRGSHSRQVLHAEDFEEDDRSRDRSVSYLVGPSVERNEQKPISPPLPVDLDDVEEIDDPSNVVLADASAVHETPAAATAAAGAAPEPSASLPTTHASSDTSSASSRADGGEVLRGQQRQARPPSSLPRGLSISSGTSRHSSSASSLTRASQLRALKTAPEEPSTTPNTSDGMLIVDKSCEEPPPPPETAPTPLPSTAPAAAEVLVVADQTAPLSEDTPHHHALFGSDEALEKTGPEPHRAAEGAEPTTTTSSISIHCSEGEDTSEALAALLSALPGSAGRSSVTAAAATPPTLTPSPPSAPVPAIGKGTTDTTVDATPSDILYVPEATPERGAGAPRTPTDGIPRTSVEALPQSETAVTGVSALSPDRAPYEGDEVEVSKLTQPTTPSSSPPNHTTTSDDKDAGEASAAPVPAGEVEEPRQEQPLAVTGATNGAEEEASGLAPLPRRFSSFSSPSSTHTPEQSVTVDSVSTTSRISAAKESGERQAPFHTDGSAPPDASATDLPKPTGHDEESSGTNKSISSSSNSSNAGIAKDALQESSTHASVHQSAESGLKNPMPDEQAAAHDDATEGTMDRTLEGPLQFQSCIEDTDAGTEQDSLVASLRDGGRRMPRSWRPSSGGAATTASPSSALARPTTPPALPVPRTPPLQRVPMTSSNDNSLNSAVFTNESRGQQQQRQQRQEAEGPGTSRLYTPRSDDLTTMGGGGAAGAAELSELADMSTGTPPRPTKPSISALAAQPTSVAAVMEGLFALEARKHAAALVELETEDRAAVEEGYMQGWWDLIVKEAAAFGALPKITTPLRSRQQQQPQNPHTTPSPRSPDAPLVDPAGVVRSPTQAPQPEDVGPRPRRTPSSSYDFNLPRQWAAPSGEGSRRASRALVSPLVRTPPAKAVAFSRDGDGGGDSDTDTSRGFPGPGLPRSRTRSPTQTPLVVPTGWEVVPASEDDTTATATTSARDDAQRSRVSLPALASMRRYATESIAANVSALCADEMLYRSYVEDKERESFYLLARLHQCVVDALQPAHLHLLENSARRAIEAECRRDDRRIRESYSYAAVDEEVRLFRDAVRQRAVLIEMEDRIRRDVLPIEEARERGQLMALFQLGLAGLLRQQAAFRAGVDAVTRENLEDLVYMEKRAREGVRVREVRDRALLYEAVAATPWFQNRTAKALHFSDTLDQEGEAVSEDEESEGNSLATPENALPEVEYYLDEEGNLRTRLSSSPSPPPQATTSKTTKRSEEGRALDSSDRLFEWDPTSNTNTSTHAPTAGQRKTAKPSRAAAAATTGSASSPSPKVRSTATDRTTPSNSAVGDTVNGLKEASRSSPREKRSQTVVVLDAKAAEASALKHALAQTEAQQRHPRQPRDRSSDSAASLTDSDGAPRSEGSATAAGPEEAAVSAPPIRQQHPPRDATTARRTPKDPSPIRLNRHVLPCSLQPFPHKSYQTLLEAYRPNSPEELIRMSPQSAITTPSPTCAGRRQRHRGQRVYDTNTLYTCSPATLQRVLGLGDRRARTPPTEWSTEEVAGDESPRPPPSPLSVPTPSPPRPDVDSSHPEAFLLSARREVFPPQEPPQNPRDSPRADTTPRRSHTRSHSPSAATGRTPGYLAPTAASLRQQQSTALLRVLRQQEELASKQPGSTTPLAARCSQSRRGRLGNVNSSRTATPHQRFGTDSPTVVTRVPQARGPGVWSSTATPRDPYGLGPQVARAFDGGQQQRSPSLHRTRTTSARRSASRPTAPSPPPAEASYGLTGMPARVRPSATSLGQQRRLDKDGNEAVNSARAQRTPYKKTPTRGGRRTASPPQLSYAAHMRGQSRAAVEERISRLAEVATSSAGPLRDLMPPSPSYLAERSSHQSHGQEGDDAASYAEIHGGGTSLWEEDAITLADGLELDGAFGHKPEKRGKGGKGGGGFVTGPNGERSWVYGSSFFRSHDSTTMATVPAVKEVFSPSSRYKHASF